MFIKEDAFVLILKETIGDLTSNTDVFSRLDSNAEILVVRINFILHALMTVILDGVDNDYLSK